ncbi:MAG TPA: glutaredoxin family protein [Pseudomonadales bacterium]|nr:glutaredoxin family protein [Pseudomonadales bacterium]HNC69519.1 glutaredoxin family protein [Pseudomonadales bacterium]HND14060.1 glutaredoxin family protein [Pseudomonadales bacterium]
MLLSALLVLLMPVSPADAGTATIEAAPTAGHEVQPLVEIYTTPSCAFCKMLRKYLQARGIEYTEHNVNATVETREAFYASGAHGVPVVVIGTRRIQGFNPLRIESALREARAAEPAN